MTEEEQAQELLEDEWVLFVVSCSMSSERLPVFIVVVEEDMEDEVLMPLLFGDKIIASINLKGFYKAMHYGLYQDFYGPDWKPVPKKLYDRRNK